MDGHQPPIGVLHRLPFLQSLHRQICDAADPNRLTPAERHNDGFDYVPTHKGVLFGHHFAAIAGAGPLVGPVLAAQMGYLPGTLWIIFGVVFAGAVQDMMVLFVSMRRDGKSLGDIVKQELGTVPGVIASIGILMIMVIIMAVLALIVVKALVHSPWVRSRLPPPCRLRCLWAFTPAISVRAKSARFPSSALSC